MKKLYFTLSFLVAIGMSLPAQVYVKHDAAGSNDGSSWTNAYTSLETALANTTSGAVWVAAGTYVTSSASASFSVPGGVSIYGGFAGTETSLDQRNVTANVTRLSGDIMGNDIAGNFATGRTDNAAHVVAVAASQSTAATIDGFTISGGNTTASGTGGGINALSTVVVKNCNLNNNFAGSGGAIYIAKQAGAGSEISNCTIGTNQSVGALYINWNDGVSVESCTFTNNANTTASSNGGAFYATNCTNLTLSKSEFSGNTSASGGALYCVTDSLPDVTNADNFIIDSCNFHDNSNTASIGGAARFRNCSYTISNSTFDKNTSVSSGGHIRNDV